MFDSNILHLSNYTNTLVVSCHAISGKLPFPFKLINFLSALGGSIALWYFVKRAKQCLGTESTLNSPPNPLFL